MKRILLMAVLLAAGLGCTRQPPGVDEAAVRKWCGKLSREKHEHCTLGRDGYLFIVANSEIELLADGSTISRDPEIHKTGFYVLPPGRWVQTVEDVLETVEPFRIKTD